MPKYAEIFHDLQHEILGGKYAGRRRLPSEAELCFRYKVSRPTAARALRELQQIGVITRKAGSGSYLVPPRGHRHAAHALGLFVPGLGNTEILDPICNEITRFAQSLDCSVLWGDAARPVTSGKDALELCQQLVERPVAGVFFSPSSWFRTGSYGTSELQRNSSAAESRSCYSIAIWASIRHAANMTWSESITSPPASS